MEKRERFMTAAAGGEVDRPPVGCWIHFGSALWKPEDSAAAHLRFYDEYDWDYIKTMNDYRLATPDGIEEVDGAEQLEALGDPALAYPGFDAQLEVLRLIRDRAPEAAVLDTMFSPVQTVIRCLGDTAVELFKSDAAVAHDVLGRVSDRLVDYVGRLRQSGGADALFLSINGAAHDASAWGLTPEQFSDWVAPYDRKVLEAAEGLIRIIHVHGYDLNEDLYADYPAEVMSWSHNQSAPTVAAVAEAGQRVPMGGLDEIGSLYWPPSKVYENVLDTRRQAGDRIILGPGCTVHSDTPPAVLRALRASADRPLS